MHFTFKQFKVRHDQCGMKVGTDGVLLGAWVNVVGAKYILDVGTGTGLIAMMVAQRSKAEINAVEIDRDASIQAGENFRQCPWSNRIKIYNESFQHFSHQTVLKYDVIVSNPPYFNNSLKSAVKQRSYARHDDYLSMESLVRCSASVVNTDGLLSVIIPYNQLDNLLQIAYLNDFHPGRLLKIKTVVHKNFSRCLVELRRDKDHLLQENELLIRDHITGEFSWDYRELTGEYYL